MTQVVRDEAAPAHWYRRVAALVSGHAGTARRQADHGASGLRSWPVTTGREEGAALKRSLVVLNGKTDTEVLDRAGALQRIGVLPSAALGVVEAPADLPRIARAAHQDLSDLRISLREGLRDAAQRAIDTGFEEAAIPLTVVEGKPFIEIIRFALAQGVDLVVKQAVAAGRRHHRLLGSTDQHLLRKCPCPVWLARSAAPAPGTVVAAVDVDEAMASEPATLHGLNLRILEAAVAAAGCTGARLTLLHAWDAPGENMLRMWSDGGDPDVAVGAYLDGIRHAHEAGLAALRHEAERMAAERGIGIAVESMLVRGEPRDVIPETVQALEASVLVMGTVARTGIPGLIIGNTAEDIVNSVECDLLTVKPQGFRTPLALD